MLARNLRDRRLQLLSGALALVLLTFAAAPLPLTRTGYEILAVVDITGSMNVRDYRGAEGGPASRLDTTKAALRALVAGLPCGSRLALGIFTERRPFLLFLPIEVCGDFAPLDGTLAALDWRMAWEGDSRIAAGLFRAIEMAESLGTDLVFVTDGQEAPPLPRTGGPPFPGKPGAVRGLIVGAGGYGLSPIPRYDDRGREVGFYGETDVQQENRFGPPPADAESREGYNPRNAPFGSSAARGSEHLSSVREPYLKALAGETGLAYAHLAGPGGLLPPVAAAATPRPVPADLDLRPFLGAAALALLLAVFAAPLLRAPGSTSAHHVPRGKKV
ncbi:VWA domain-containing protein [Methylobacterium planeticum]|uniref:VWA domain-containing protein n=1 Tax=Methylobacterium planeticum TaxID=2615211 RepID=A0A6N6MT77_9HYPH|nr:vWA domain-containing protein [Methylobacterium planeticum]KAB1074501.1 VWA domain-containing protein [Methylobacterium planeticum]